MYVCMYEMHAHHTQQQQQRNAQSAHKHWLAINLVTLWMCFCVCACVSSATALPSIYLHQTQHSRKRDNLYIVYIYSYMYIIYSYILLPHRRCGVATETSVTMVHLCITKIGQHSTMVLLYGCTVLLCEYIQVYTYIYKGHTNIKERTNCMHTKCVPLSALSSREIACHSKRSTMNIFTRMRETILYWRKRERARQNIYLYI